MIDVENYELLLQRNIVIEGIAQGEQALVDGRVATHAQAKERLARWLTYSQRKPPPGDLASPGQNCLGETA